MRIYFRVGDDDDDGLDDEDIVESEDVAEMCGYFHLCTYLVVINGSDDSYDEYNRQNDCAVSKTRTLGCLKDYRATTMHL